MFGRYRYLTGMAVKSKYCNSSKSVFCMKNSCTVAFCGEHLNDQCALNQTLFPKQVSVSLWSEKSSRQRGRLSHHHRHLALLLSINFQ